MDTLKTNTLKIDTNKIGIYLTEMRKFYNLTQDDLANKLNISRQAISKWETGISIPDIEMLLKLSELYGITINDIVSADCSRIKHEKEISHIKRSKETKKITVIGCGRWGSFIAWYLDRIGHNVSLYGRKNSTHLKKLIVNRSNEFLDLSEKIILTDDLNSVKNSEIIVISIPSQELQKLAEELAKLQIRNKTIVLCMKGIEITTSRRLSQVIDDTLDYSNKVAVWMGPGHVEEFCRGIPNCMVIDSNDELTKEYLMKEFSSELIRFYYGMDLVGNEIGAAAKNVIGIAAGMLDGVNLRTLKGALMSRGTREMARLIKAMGGNELSAYGLCHLGDYEATLFSEYSHNRKYGECIVKGEEYHQLAEGYYTVKALCNLGKNYGIELPICNAVYQILYNKKDSKIILNDLFTRSLKEEF